jgi:hypothetical protein
MEAMRQWAALGRVPKTVPPIIVFEKNGVLYSMNNRRLVIAQMLNYDIRYVLAKKGSPEEFSHRWTLIENGTGILIRFSRFQERWAWWSAYGLHD